MRRQLLFAMACTLCSSTWADYYLVVQAANAQPSMTQKEAVDLFMGRQRTFRNGDLALVIDLPRDHPQREGFYKALTGLSLAQVNSYWSRLMFSGENRPPLAAASEAAAMDMVRRNPKAMTWLPQEPVDKQLHVVLVLKVPN